MNYLKKKFQNIIHDKYTLMLIPNKTGSTRYFVLSKIIIPILLLLFIFISSGIFFLYKSYVKLKSANIILKQNTELYIASLSSLKNKTAENGLEINKYKDNELTIKNKLEELLDLESKINNIINNKSSNIPISRGEMSSPLYLNVINTNEGITRLNDLLVNMNTFVLKQRKIPSILPCGGKITSYFGNRVNPYGYSSEFHHGLDIANSSGTEICSAADGIVTRADSYEGYGNVVIINHGNGYETFYGHNSRFNVKVGDFVKRGSIIAFMGSTGRSTGPHSHFEVRLNGSPVNPLNLVKGGL